MPGNSGFQRGCATGSDSQKLGNGGRGIRPIAVLDFPLSFKKTHMHQLRKRYYCLGSSTSICSRQHFLDGAKGGSFARRRVARIRFDRRPAPRA
jgi:hypothetical protein